MQVSRRAFLAVGAGLTATATLVHNSPLARAQTDTPTRLPLDEFVQDQRLMDALRRGVQVMRSRPGSDPRSWFWQGAVHAFNDEIYGEAVLSDPRVAQVDARKFWNQCPHFGQSSANFLIWHRAYLYYFERILRDAAQEPDLALPYWRYDDPSQRGFPAAFAPQFLDRDRRLPNPLYHRNREAAFVSGRFDISETVAAAARAMAARQFFSSPGNNGFGGDIREDGSTIQGEIELRPHNDLHVAVGGVIGSNNGAMADVPTAAFDPVFWVHHANIDRMWRKWASTPGKEWGPLPPKRWFDEAPWTFIDFDGSEQTRPRRFYIEKENLAVRYAGEGPVVGLQLPEQTRLFAAALPSERTQALFRSTMSAAVGGDAEAVSVPVDADDVEAPPPVHGASPRAGRRLVVRLSDIRYDRLPANGFKIFFAPEGAVLSDSSPYFLGTLNLFGFRHDSNSSSHGGDHAGRQDFDATRLVGQVGREDLRLQILPYPLYESRSADESLREDGVRIGQVTLLMTE